MKRSTIVVLDNIRSAQNVGAIFRTADGAGIDRIVLLGYTPAPIDRFGRVRSDIHKAALGAEKHVPWESHVDAKSVLVSLRQDGHRLVAVEQTKDALPYYEVSLNERVAYIFGNEIEGVRNEVLALVDEAVHIPMHGTKESLNVSVAAGVILFHQVSTQSRQRHDLSHP